ncbi:MAG TPA: MurT ligase domain-containing protein [Solirubrobacteraceae bacterium]|nr:MurT ligase domain-containing protein [Solirubrobacteraceae bacterium]
MNQGRQPPATQPTLFEQVWLDGRLEDHLDTVYRDPGVPAPVVESGTASGLTYTKRAVARAAGRVSRASGRGGGTTAPGRLLLRMAPGAIDALGRRLRGGVTLISSTNGKTTTARMLASILEADGRAVVHNRAGANTHWGVATALAEHDGDTGVFEVDEAWLPLIAAQLRPRVVVLGNLFRDRLDGYGELDRLIRVWRGLLSGAAAPAVVVANADDPLLAGPGAVLAGARSARLLFGIEDAHAGSHSPEHPNDGHSCLACGQRLRYTRAFVGHLGHYHCDRCGTTRPRPSVRAASVRERGLDAADARIVLPSGSLSVRLPFGGLHNVYNALAASGAAVSIGVAPGAIRDGLASVSAPFGRSETIVVDGRAVRLCLVKNPAGANATIRTLSGERSDHALHLWIALNDAEPDGRDVSWIWDVQFECLSAHVGRVTCSGRRANELALRLKYAGWSCPLEVNASLHESFARALAHTPAALVAMPTYTALLGLRTVLNERGVAVSDWGHSARAARATP